MFDGFRVLLFFIRILYCDIEWLIFMDFKIGGNFDVCYYFFVDFICVVWYVEVKVIRKFEKFLEFC